MAESSSFPKYRTIYFDFEGRAESIYLTFALAGVPHEEHRFKDRAELAALKASGRLMFGQVPALEIIPEAGEPIVVLNQTAAIMRFVAKLKPEAGLYPTDAVAAARVDAIVDQRADCFSGLMVSKYQERFGFGFLNDQPALAEEAQNAWHAEVAPRHLGTLAALLEQGGTGWLAGTPGPSIADALWAVDLARLGRSQSGDASVLAAFPTLVDLTKRFYELPAITAYYAAKAKV